MSDCYVQNDRTDSGRRRHLCFIGKREAERMGERAFQKEAKITAFRKKGISVSGQA